MQVYFYTDHDGIKHLVDWYYNDNSAYSKETVGEFRDRFKITSMYNNHVFLKSVSSGIVYNITLLEFEQAVENCTIDKGLFTATMDFMKVGSRFTLVYKGP